MLDMVVNIAQVVIAMANLVMIWVLIEQNSPQLIIKYHSRDDDVEESNRINIKDIVYLTIINISQHKIAENITIKIHIKSENKKIKEYKAQLDPISFLNPYEAVKVPISLEEFISQNTSHFITIKKEDIVIKTPKENIHLTAYIKISYSHSFLKKLWKKTYSYEFKITFNRYEDYMRKWSKDDLLRYPFITYHNLRGKRKYGVYSIKGLLK